MTETADSWPQPENFISTAAYLDAFETFHDQRKPSQQDVLDRATRLASEAMRAIELQVRRLRSTEPEDDEWLFRKWTDAQFLVLALWRLRAAGRLASSVAHTRSELQVAIADFDGRLPDLSRMRHVGQHIDAYAVDDPKRRQRKPGSDELVGRRALEVGSWSDEHFSWLGGTIQFSEAQAAASVLYAAIRTARRRLQTESDLQAHR